MSEVIVVTELGCRHGNRGPTSVRKSGVGGRLRDSRVGWRDAVRAPSLCHPQLVWDELSNPPNFDSPPRVTHSPPDSSLGRGSGGSDDQGRRGEAARPCLEGGLWGAETP